MKRKDVILKLLVIMLMCFIAVSGCDTGDGNGTGNNSGTGNNNGTGNNGGNGNNGTGDNGGKQGFLALARMDIEDANNLFIASNPATSEDELYKITDSGSIEEVTYYDNGNSLISETPSPSEIFVLNSDYLIVSYGSKGNFLVNSNTGDCYVYTNDLPYNSNRPQYKGEYIGEDENGNIYFIAYGSRNSEPFSEVKKLSLINNVSISTISAPNDYVRFFGLDKAGNIAYEASQSSGNSVLRFRKNSGGYELLPGTANFGGTRFWTGLNGNLYYYNYTNEDPKIKQLIGDPFTINDYTGTYSVFMAGGYCRILLKIRNKERIILLSDGSECYEVYNGFTNQASIISYSTFGLVSVNNGIASDYYYYLAGISTGTPRNVLVKIDPANNSYTTLLDGGYDIYKMTVSNDDFLTFNALRMSDGAIVIGEISATGQMRILDATLTSEVVVLERIR